VFLRREEAEGGDGNGKSRTSIATRYIPVQDQQTKHPPAGFESRDGALSPHFHLPLLRPNTEETKTEETNENHSSFVGSWTTSSRVYCSEFASRHISAADFGVSGKASQRTVDPCAAKLPWLLG